MRHPGHPASSASTSGSAARVSPTETAWTMIVSLSGRRLP
jgi:hypothetical protein